MDRPPCSRCQTDTFVRVEQVLSGRRVYHAFYCGRCGDEWQVEHTHTQERRQAERRKQRVDALSDGLEKRLARVSLLPKRDRRTAK